MVIDNGNLTSAIKKWLSDHPLTQDMELAVHDIPPEIFDLTDTSETLKTLNRQIKALSVRLQKLLLYLSRDLDLALILESMEYASPELFWQDKELLIKELDLAGHKQEIHQVFEINESLLVRMNEISDLMDIESDRNKRRTYRNISLVAVPVILLLVYLLVYPMLIRPDPVALYEKFRLTYRPDLSAIDTTSYTGGSYYEAVLLMDEGNYEKSATLFEELIAGENAYRISSIWFLALINLRNGDTQSCREELKVIQADDPDFYSRVAAKLWNQL